MYPVTPLPGGGNGAARVLEDTQGWMPTKTHLRLIAWGGPTGSVTSGGWLSAYEKVPMVFFSAEGSAQWWFLTKGAHGEGWREGNCPALPRTFAASPRRCRSW